MRSVGGQAFDRRNWGINRRNLRLASPSGLATDVDRAGSALSNATSKFRPLHTENVSQYPEEWHFWWYINRFGLPVYSQLIGHISNLLKERIERQAVGTAM